MARPLSGEYTLAASWGLRSPQRVSVSNLVTACMDVMLGADCDAQSQISDQP